MKLPTWKHAVTEHMLGDEEDEMLARPAWSVRAVILFTDSDGIQWVRIYWSQEVELRP